MPAIQILSDLHLEAIKSYDILQITPKAPYLALLGDIGSTKHKDEYIGILDRQLPLFKAVLLILGNHEPYHSTWNESKEILQEYESDVRERRKRDASLGEFVLLDQTRYDLDSDNECQITILGCTLFSKVPPEAMESVSFGLNDFYYINGWTVEQHNDAFDSDQAWLNSQVENLQGSGRKIIIFTHYQPTLDERAMDPIHNTSRIMSGFATDMAEQPCWKSTAVKLWAYGHTHFNCDFIDKVTGKRVYSNQFGYYFKQAAGYDGDRTVKL